MLIDLINNKDERIYNKVISNKSKKYHLNESDYISYKNGEHLKIKRRI